MWYACQCELEFLSFLLLQPYILYLYHYTDSSLMAPGKESDETTRDEPPTRGAHPYHFRYVVTDGKTTLEMIRSIAAIIPVPFVKGTIEVAIQILVICQDVMEIKDTARALEDRLYNIVHAITAALAEGSDINEAASKLEGHVKTLKSTLETILQELNQIKSQNTKGSRVFRRGSIKSKLEACTNRLDNAVELLHVTSDLRFANILQNLQNQLKEINQLLNKVPTHTASNAVIEPIPRKPIVFYDRDSSVETVVGFLCNQPKPRVCILGSGGMGKTTLAAAVIESKAVQDKFKHHFWVPCIQATSTALFLDLMYTYLQVDRSSGNVLKDICEELNASKDLRLILLDNFETLWYNSKTRPEINKVLPKLADIPHVAILVTMRGDRPPCHEYIEWTKHKIGSVDEDASRRIYHGLNPDSLQDPDVNELLVAIGCLPFAITLMANRGEQSRSSARHLLKEWKGHGTDMISDEEGNLNHSISLSVDSEFVQKNRDAVGLLATLSLLPAGTHDKRLRWWAPQLTHVTSAKATLTGAGLLDDKTPQILSTLPVVQSFMCSAKRIPDDIRKQVLEGCCNYVIDHACFDTDLRYQERSEALAVEAANIQSVLLASRHTMSDNFVKALLDFARFRLDTRPSMEVAQYALEVAQSSKNERFIGEAFVSVGGTHWRLGNFEDAERYLSKGYEWLSNVPIANDHDIQQLIIMCHWSLAQTRVHLGRPPADLLAFADQLHVKLHGVKDDFLQASVFRVLGLCYLYAGDLSLGVDNLRQAANTFKQINNLDCRADLADANQILAKIYHTSSQLPEALEAIEDASRAINCSNYKRMRGVIQRVRGEILITLGRYEEAFSQLEESLLLSQQVGHLFGTAWTLEHLGYIYASWGKYEDGIIAYENAIKAYSQANTEASSVGGQGLQRCQENLIKIREKQKDQENMDISLIRFISTD